MVLTHNQMAYTAIAVTMIFGSLFVGLSGFIQTSENLGFEPAGEDDLFDHGYGLKTTLIVKKIVRKHRRRNDHIKPLKLETIEKVIQRCILMTSDPSDIVFGLNNQHIYLLDRGNSQIKKILLKTSEVITFFDFQKYTKIKFLNG